MLSPYGPSRGVCPRGCVLGIEVVTEARGETVGGGLAFEFVLPGGGALADVDAGGFGGGGHAEMAVYGASGRGGSRWTGSN